MAQSLPHAFKCAFEGVRFALGQRNMRIDVCAAILAVALGFALRIDASSWLAIVFCIALVLALETANTAIEAVVDLVSPEYHVLAKHAKDCAAGAALILAATSVVVAAIVFIPKIGELLC